MKNKEIIYKKNYYNKNNQILSEESSKTPNINYYEYNEKNLLIKKYSSLSLFDDLEINYKYDDRNNLIEEVNYKKGNKTFEYNEQNQLISKRTLNFNSQRSTEIKYIYDENNGNLIKHISKFGIANYLYNENNLLREFINYDGNSELYEYDDRGNCIHIEYDNGAEIHQEYNEKNLLIKYWDTSGDWKSFEYDENNNIIKEESNDFEIIIKNEYELDFDLHLNNYDLDF